MPILRPNLPNTTPSSKVPEGGSAALKRPATSNIEEQAETQIKKPALRPSTRIQATKQAAATSTPGPTSNPQQETTAGNAPNSKGSVSGEAGTRKSQKPQGLIFGSIQVSKMVLNSHQRSFIWLFISKDHANDYCEMVDLIYHNSALNLFKITKEELDFSNLKSNSDKLFVCISTFNFNIKFGTLANKLKLAISPDKYCAAYYFNILQRLDDIKHIEDDDKVKVALLKALRILIKNGDFGYNILEQIEKEEQRAKYSPGNSSSSSVIPNKKRRFE
nr:unnamed protein product [Callosobruchus analis]